MSSSVIRLPSVLVPGSSIFNILCPVDVKYGAWTFCGVITVLPFSTDICLCLMEIVSRKTHKCNLCYQFICEDLFGSFTSEFLPCLFIEARSFHISTFIVWMSFNHKLYAYHILSDKK